MHFRKCSYITWKCDATKLLLCILLTNKKTHEVPLYRSTWTSSTDWAARIVVVRSPMFLHRCLSCRNVQSLLHHGTNIEMAGRWRRTSPKGVTDLENTQPNYNTEPCTQDYNKGPDPRPWRWVMLRQLPNLHVHVWVKYPNTNQCILLKQD